MYVVLSVVARRCLVATSLSLDISTITIGIDIAGVAGCLYTITKEYSIGGLIRSGVVGVLWGG
jgi:hypothetical protein